MPAHTVSIDVSVAVTSDSSIAVGWDIPGVVFAQHTDGDVYSVVALPDCKNGQNTGVTTPRQSVLAYDGDRSVEITGLRTLLILTACK